MSDFYLNLKSHAEPNDFKVRLRDRRELSKGKWKVALVGLWYTKSPWISIKDQSGIWPNTVSIEGDKPMTVQVFHSRPLVITENGEIDMDTFDDPHLGITPHLDQIINGVRERCKKPKEINGEYIVETSVLLSPGYYLTPNDFARELVGSFNLTRNRIHTKTISLDYAYNANDKTVSITGADAYAFYNSNAFVAGLGLVGGEKLVSTVGSNRSCTVFYGNLFGRNGKPPNVHKYVHITTNIIGYERLNTCKERLLATIPVKVIGDDRFQFAPYHREYKPVVTNTLSVIHFQVIGNNGKPVRISHGTIIVKLHFKKMTSIK